ncbi:MAG: Gfo/Idh/MocA family oxidoreductase, partial [candidate division NC10 bacterium]
DWRRLVEDPGLDAIAVAVPPQLQPEIVLAALRRGKHVFCEKPLAAELQSARELALAARKAGVANMVDFELPALPAWRRLKGLLEGGALGRLRHAVVSWQVETWASRRAQESWKNDPARGGGVLNGFCSHLFYNVEWLLGPVDGLWARLFDTKGPARGRSDTLASLCLRLASGAPVCASVCSSAPSGTGHRWELYGDRGCFVLENPTRDYARGFRLSRRTGSAIRPASAPLRDRSKGPGGRPAAGRELVRAFLKWIRSGVPAAPTLDHGYRVQCLLDAARRSDASGRWVAARGGRRP